MEHHFRFRQGDFELAFSGERAFVEAQIQRFASRLEPLAGERAAASASVPALPAGEHAAADPFPRVSADFRPRRNLSLADFVAAKAAVAPADLLVVAAYYLEKYCQSADYTVEELQSQLAPLPAWACERADDVLPLVLLQGYLEALRDGRYTLTYKGQTYVRDGLA